MTEPALTEHPETKEPVKRLIQPVGIAFKGSGFYVNDSRGNKSTSKAAAKSKETPKETNKTETKEATSKPANTSKPADTSKT